MSRSLRNPLLFCIVKKQLTFGWVRAVLVAEMKNSDEIVSCNNAEQQGELDLCFAPLMFFSEERIMAEH